MLNELAKIIPDHRIRSRYIDLVTYASDAGFYHLLPKAVVQPINESEIIALFGFARRQEVPIVFRTAGTSLSGQAITDGILVDLSQHWNNIEIEQEGKVVRVQPGVRGGMVNARLQALGCKIGPDPASIQAAMMGGILSNNASGMCCGVKLNSYHTTRHIRFILPGGQTFSTENPGDYERFQQKCPELYKELANIREQILADSVLHNKIRSKYRTKTTIGYALNAFVDFEHPLDTLAHLLIGAEGTLAFIAEAVLETVPDHPCKSTALLYFPDIYTACQAIVPATGAGAEMVELMDRASLRAVQDMDGIPAFVAELPPEAAALLIEFQEPTPDQLSDRVHAFLDTARTLQLLHAPQFTEDSGARARLWKVRKGLFPAVGAVRKRGTTVILEDIAFPVAQLGAAILDLQRLFQQYQYEDAIIFGHAKDGNLHFVVTQALNCAEEIDRYDRFMQDVVKLVVEQYQGTLKAEHGTGRNMAPFVETEWGGEAYRIMQRIKAIVDPEQLLNTGVIINTDPKAHIRDLKKMPQVEEEVDRCTECGFCEHVCPSRDVTLTPRRRIVARRMLRRLQEEGDHHHHQQLLNQYQYSGNSTCAVDGLCSIACPVDINTGELTKRLRRENHSPMANRIALWIARHFAAVERTTRLGLKAGHGINRWFGKATMTRITSLIRRPLAAFPLWNTQLPTPPDLSKVLSTKAPVEHPSHAGIVYFPACISRLMGTYTDQKKSLMETFISIGKKVDIPINIPTLAGQCCSQIFSSKGYTDARNYMAHKIIDHLWSASQQGRLPIVMDVSSCTYTLLHVRPVLDQERQNRFDRLTILDSIDWLHDQVLPRMAKTPADMRVVLHPVCSLHKMQTADKMIRIARQCAREVIVPAAAGCCGMAGDRGFLFPELTESATHAEAAEVQAGGHFDGYYASTKTCEMALSQAVQANYESILYLVDRVLPES